jgi:hypothetical protein
MDKIKTPSSFREEGVLLVLFIFYTIRSSSSATYPGGNNGCNYGAVNYHFCNACKVSRYFLNLQMLWCLFYTPYQI